jgi:DNA-binding NarL/FixJ family response regulator
VSVEVAQSQRREVLVLGADALVRDNVRVMLGSMGYHCVVASTLKEALVLLEDEKPDAVVLDPRQVGFPPARMVAAFHKMVPALRGRAIVLTDKESDPELLRVLDSYSLTQVPRDLLLQKVWPSLDSLLRRNIVHRQVTQSARLVLDSYLQPLCTGVRCSQQFSARRLRYESEGLTADISLEPQENSQRITIVGQVLDAAQPERQLANLCLVLQGQEGPIAVATTKEFGEFHFDFDSERGVSLEIGVKENHWVALELPDPKGPIQETTEESRLPETAADSRARKDLLPKKKNRR